MVNTNELKAEMRRNAVTQEKLAKIVKLDISTLNRKINNKSAVFTVCEAQAISEALHLSPERSAAIFFAQ
ncbi:MAG: helix-turn-helix domain-containing protein [Lachnospiraceae bacterium]|nr:helix-turn-helix domain-containing protein [Lachnospiraceae bacterium]